MSEQPLVNVLTPVYNGEAFLEECIESILRQTYRHYEYIIVNNRSKDRSLDIALASRKEILGCESTIMKSLPVS